MSILGTLTLDLSAPTAQLSRDLDRAQQLAREAASKMGGIKPVWGIASSLQEEMRASRSILNSSLKSIESDTNGYRPMVRVGVDFDGGAIDTQMQSLEREFSQRSAYLNRQVITPQVDDSQLTALNKHLSIKERHLDTVVAKFANTRIAPSVDTSQIDRMGAALNSLDRPRSLRIDLPDSIDGIKIAIGKLVLSPVSLPIKIAQDTFTGMFEGLGRQLSKNFSKGFSGSIESFITRKVGMSTGDMGKESGKYIAKNTYLWGEYVSRAQGYERGMAGVGEDIAKVGGVIDQVANPVKFRRNIRRVENNYVAYQEKRQAGDVEGANEIKEQAIKPFVDGAQTIAKRVAGVGLRIAAQPYRIRKRVRLAQSIEDANQQAKDLEIPNYDREKAEQAESINLVMGGIDFNGTRNTAFASSLMSQVLPKGYTVPVTTPFSNTPVEKGSTMVDGIMRSLLIKMAGGDESAVAKMPVAKLLEIAVSKGYNPDAIKAYAHVKRIREMHPDKPINVMGTSGGSAVAEEVISMAERDGDKNVRGLGIGLPFHGLTGTAGKQFSGTIGDLDPLALSAYGTQYTQRKLTPEQLAKLPFSGNGLLAPDRARSTVIPNAGVDHNIGMFSVNQDFQQIARSQLKAFTNPDLVGRQGIVNLNPYVQQNAEDLTIPRTIKAMFGDRQAEKDIVVGGEYAFYKPDNPDWRRDNDFAAMKAGVASKVKSTKGLPKEHADEYMEFLDTMHSELTAFYESKGKIKPLKTLEQATKFYPELDEFAAQKGIKVTGERAFQYREQPQKAAKPEPVTQPEAPAYDPFEGAAEKLAAKVADRKQRKTDDPWSDNYAEPQLDLSTPQNVQAPLNLNPRKRKQRKQRELEYVNAEFVEQPQLNGFQQFNRSINQTMRAGAETANAIAETAKAGAEGAKLLGESAKAGQKAAQLAGNIADAGSAGTKLISETATAGSKIMRLVGSVADAAGEGVKLIGETARTATAMMGGAGDAVRAMTGRSDNLREIGGGGDLPQLEGGMRTIQAIEGDDDEQKQLGAQVVRLALPPSDDLAKSKAWMKSVEGVFQQKKSAIYKAIESGDLALAKQLNDDYKRSITELESEIAASVKNGDKQTKEFYNSGGIKNQLTHKKRFAENIDVATDLIETNASPSDVKQAQIVSDANLRKLTARTINNRRNNRIEQPAIDVGATPVIDVAPTRVKQTDGKIIGDMLKDRKLKIEQAIEDGDLNLVRSHRQELDALVQDGRDLIAANPNSISLKSNLAAELTNKDKFSQSAGNIADLMDGGATANDIDNQPNTTAKLKKSAKLGLKSLLIDRMRDRNNEAGFANIEAIIGSFISSLIGAAAIPLVGAPVAIPAIVGGGLIAALKNSPFAKSQLGQTPIPGLDFLDTPVQSFKNTFRKPFRSFTDTIGLTTRESVNQQGMMLGGDGAAQYTPESTKLQSLIASTKSNFQQLKSTISQPIQSIVAKTQNLRDNPIQEIRAGLILAESESGKIRQSIGNRLNDTWRSLLDPVKQQIESIKSVTAGKISDIKDATEQLRTNPIQEIRAGLILAESESRKAARSIGSGLQSFRSNPMDSIRSIGSGIGNTFDRLNPFKSRPQSPQQPIAPQPIIPDAAEKSETALSKLVGVGKLALGVFGGFSALSLGVPAMISLGKSVFDTAANFERLQVKMAAASDSAQSGKQKFAQLSATADNLGISRSSALETGAYIGGTTFGTQLDGAPSDAITKQILQVAQARGLNKQETDGLNLALGQTLGRSRTSAQEINQLTQSAGITDARAIAARGLGMTAAQFSQVQDSPTGIDSKRFVQAFLTQAVQDAQSGKALAQDSVGFKQGQLRAATERTAGNLGAPMMPVVKLALDGITSALKLFNDGLERSSGLLMGLALGGIAAIGVQAVTSGTVLNTVLGMTGNAIRAVGTAAFGTLPSIGAMSKAMAIMAGYAIGMAVAGEVYRQVLEITKNQSQDLADAASKIGEATRESEKEKGKPKEGEKQTTNEIGGRDWGESAILGMQRGVKFISGGRTVDNKEKESNDRKIAASEIIVNSNQQMLKTDAAIKAAESVTQIDLDLARIDTERSGLFSGGNPDGTKLAALDAEYQKKTGERQKVIDNITPQKTDLQNAINANKGGIAKLNKELADGQITRPEYDEQLKNYNQTIKSLESNMRDLNAATRSSFDNLQPWLTTLSQIVAKFEDIGVVANTSRERFAMSRNAGEIGGRLTRGGSERQAAYDNNRITSEEIKARKAVINELKGSLGNLDRNNIPIVQKAYGLTDASSSAQIKIAAGNATSVNDKTTLEKLATIKDEQLKIATLDATLSNSHAETYRRIYAENREAALYYTSLSQQIDPKGVMFAKNISAITAEKARFMSKLQNYGTGGFDVYTTAIIDLMDLAKDRMTALAKLAADKKAAIDAQTNRNNDIEGKRQNDFDTNPGTQQPSVGKISGLAQNGNTTAPQVGSNQQESVNTPSPTIQSVEPPLPPKTIKVKRSKTFIDANGYTDSPNPAIQAQIRARLASGGTGIYNDKGERTGTDRFKPSDADRYLNTTQAIGSRTYDANGKPNGYTDLGFDEIDKRPGGLRDKLSKNPRKPQRSKITVQYEEEIPNPEYQRAVNARNKRKSASNTPQPAPNQVTPQSTQSITGGLNTGQLRDKSQIASDKIYQEAIDRANATFSELGPVEKLKETKTMQDLERNSRLAKQSANKFKRDQDSTQLNAKPAISIQDTQERETLSQRNALADNRDSVSNARIDMESQIKNVEVSIQVLADLAAKKNRTPHHQELMKKLKIAVPKLKADLPILRQALSRLRASEANLPANDAEAIAALQANQKYQLEVSKEREDQDRKASAIGQNQIKLTDIDQQLTNAPLDQNLLKSQRELNKQIAIDRAKMTRVDEDRKVAERERSDATYSPKLAAAARKRNQEIEQNTIKNAENKQAQESVRAANTINQELASVDIAELKLGQSSGDLGVRFAQSQDKIDAPFANTRTLDLELQQKLSAIEIAKVERNKNFEQQRIKYAGTSDANIKLLASLDRQQKEADRQSEVEKKVAETESGIAVRGVQSQRKGYLYGQQQAKFTQQIGIYDAQTTGDKQRGQDTRDREYTSAVKRKQLEYFQKEFDLKQQRDAITGLTPEADAARASIDGLIAGLKEMESIELSNMANQFDRFNQVLGETQKTTQSVLEKFVKTGKFDWKSILRTPLEGGISQIMGKIVPDLFSGLYRKNPAAESQSQPTSQPQPNTPQALPNQAYSNITPVQPNTPQSSIIGNDGMVNVPIPGGGNYRIPREQAISEGFMRLDGSSTSEPEVNIRQSKITQPAPQNIESQLTDNQLLDLSTARLKSGNLDLQPNEIQPPEVTIAPYPHQTIDPPPIISSPTPAIEQGGEPYDIRQLPMPGRKPVKNFSPSYNPNAGMVVAPPMPVNEFEGMPGYTVPKPQQRASFSGGDAMSLASLIPGMGGAGKYMGLLGKIGGLFGMGFADGGMVPSDSKFGEFRQGNDPIGAALRKEGHNSVIAALTPGERVLTVSESRYYETMFPQGIKGYADGGVVGNIKPIPLNLDQSKIDNRGDSNEFNFDIKNGGGENAKMTKENLKEMENAVVAVLLKQKRARTGLVPN